MARRRAEAATIIHRIHAAGRRQFGPAGVANLENTRPGRELDELVLIARGRGATVREAQALREELSAIVAMRVRAWWEHWIRPELERLAEMTGHPLPEETALVWCLAHQHYVDAGTERCGPEGNATNRERLVPRL